MAGNTNDFTPGGVFAGENINFTNNSGLASNTDIHVGAVVFNDTDNMLTLQLTNGTNLPVDLSALAGGGGNVISGDNIESFTLVNGTDLQILLTNGDKFTQPLGGIIPDVPSDSSTYLDSVDLTGDVLTIGRNDDVDVTVNLGVFREVDNQTGASRSFTQGEFVYSFTADNKIVITAVGVPVPVFTPSENPPDPVNALDVNLITFPPIDSNDGFVIDNVAVTDVKVTDTDGNDIPVNNNIAVVQSDDSIIVNLPDGEAIDKVDLVVDVTDEDGDVQEVETEGQVFVPFYTNVTPTNMTFATVAAFRATADESAAELGSNHTIAGKGNGRRKYWIMTNGMHNFSNQGLPLSATIIDTAKIQEYTYTLYDLGTFGNPFDNSVAAPDLILNIT